MTLTRLPLEERPRERLLTKGIDALSLSELIAIILGSGTKGKSVLHLAEEIISHFGDIKQLLEASVEELIEINGIGIAKAIQLKAVFGLAMRYGAHAPPLKNLIKTPQDVFELLQPSFHGRKQEVLSILLRDIKGYAFHQEIISMGTLSEVLIHPREVFYHAIRHKAHSLVIAHNHPSGNPEPSRSDIDLTKLLITSSRVVGIRLDDHLILGEGVFVSMWERGFLIRKHY